MGDLRESRSLEVDLSEPLYLNKERDAWLESTLPRSRMLRDMRQSRISLLWRRPTSQDIRRRRNPFLGSAMGREGASKPCICTTSPFASPRCVSDCVARKVKQNL